MLSLEALKGETARIYTAIEKLARVSIHLSVEQARPPFLHRRF